MTLPLHELAALGTATCWALTGLIAADAVRMLGPFYFNLLRQWCVTLLLAGIAALTFGGPVPQWQATGLLALSGIVGILLGDTFNFAAVGRLGPRRAGAIFALNAPIAALLGWAVLGENLPLSAVFGICITAAGVALAILGRPAPNAHRLETTHGTVLIGVVFGLGAALGQALGTLIAKPVMAAGIDPYVASLLRVGASGLMMAMIAPFGPKRPQFTPIALAITAVTAVIGLLFGMTLLLYALKGAQTGIISTLSATSPIIILPLLWLRTGQRPSGLSWCGGLLAVLGLALIFTT